MNLAELPELAQEEKDFPFIVKKVQIGAGRPKKAIREQKIHQIKREEQCNDKQKKYHLEKSNDAQLKKKENMIDTDEHEKRANPIIQKAIDSFISILPESSVSSLI